MFTIFIQLSFSSYFYLIFVKFEKQNKKRRMPESETGTPTAASVPATPDTPGGPLFTSLRVDSLSHERDSFAMARCKCLPTKGHICFTDFSVGVPLPNVSLTQKVSPSLFRSTPFICIFLTLFNR